MCSAFLQSKYFEEGNEMLKRTLIAITVVALIATSAQALGPVPHTNKADDAGNPIFGTGQIKVNNMNMTIGWPFEYKALNLCVIPVYMNVGYYVQVEKCNERKIQLEQVDCADIGKGSGDFPCYKDCETVKIRSNFEVKIGVNKEKVGGVLNDWKAYIDGSDVVTASTGWKDISVCVEAWKTKLLEHAPGTKVEVGKVILTVKPNV